MNLNLKFVLKHEYELKYENEYELDVNENYIYIVYLSE